MPGQPWRGALPLPQSRIEVGRTEESSTPWWQPFRHSEATFWIVVWLSISPMILFSVKHITNDRELAFPYPFLLTGSCNLVIFVVGSLLLKFPGVNQKNDSQVSWQMATVLGVINGVEVGVGNTVVKYLSLSLRQELHMMSPALMYLCGRVFGLEHYNPMVTLAVLLMTFGGMLSVWGRVHVGNIPMFLLAIVSAVCSVIRWNLTQKMLALEGKVEKPSAFVLAVRQSLATACACLAISSCFEDVPPMMLLPHVDKVAKIVIGIGCGLCVMCMAEMRTVQLTSALFVAFFAPIHNVSIIVLDVIVKGAHVSGINWLGIICVTIATALYMRTRQKEVVDQSHLPLKPS
jgi:drug/metabolite transporter (DMT)-like permease